MLNENLKILRKNKGLFSRAASSTIECGALNRFKVGERVVCTRCANAYGYCRS